MTFSSGNSNNVRLIIKMIKKYERSFGQKVNENKSFVLIDTKTSAYRINRLKSCTGFMEKNFPFTYLGCPLYVGRRRVHYFDEMVTEVVKRVSGWHGKLLPPGGRMVLIKSVLQAIPTYSLSAICPPKTSLQLLEKHFARYFWGSTYDKK